MFEFMDRKILNEGLLTEQYALTKEQELSFEKYARLLVEWNKKINLTALTEPQDISIKHFLDSVLPLFKVSIPENSSIIDVGTGAGFPGIPMKILRNDLSFTYLDSLNKRIKFLETVSAQLGFENVNFVHERAEIAGKNPLFREKYDFAVSRAVAPLKILCEYCIPFLKVGGTFLAFKSNNIEDELNEAKSMIGVLGGTLIETKLFTLPGTDVTRKIVIIKKKRETDIAFPRPSKKIK